MQISTAARAVGRKHHVIGTSMSSNKRVPGQRTTALSQEEYSIFSPVSSPGPHCTHPSSINTAMPKILLDYTMLVVERHSWPFDQVVG